MVNRQVTKKHILDAMLDIDKNGVPPNRRATRFNLYYNNKSYPPKYVLSVATKIATGKELKPSQFNGGNETNNFLSSLDFIILEGNKSISAQIIKPPVDKMINICTAVIQTEYSSDYWDDKANNEKFELLSSIFKTLSVNTDILILPAGFLNSKNKNPETIFKETEKAIKTLINTYNKNIFVCFGIDGKCKSDQLALAINYSGIVAIARKFHHMNNSINLADNAFEKENGKERHFIVKDKKAYLAVCYDIFGITHNKLENKSNCDFVIGTIHGFGGSGGDSDFARKGLAGASKQWDVHIYASAVFSDNRNPTNWTSGVEWTHGNKSVNGFTYDDIRIKSKLEIKKTELATIYFRHYIE
jgi:predicted amidohydrolase